MYIETLAAFTTIFIIVIFVIGFTISRLVNRKYENRLAASSALLILLMWAYIIFVGFKLSQSKTVTTQIIVYTDRKQSCQIIESGEAVWLKSDKEYITNLRDYRVDKLTYPLFRGIVDVQKSDEYLLVYSLDGTIISKLNRVDHD